MKNKLNSRDIVIGLMLVALLIVGSYAANYYAPQNNQKINEESYMLGARTIAFKINNNSIIPIWNPEEQDYEWIPLQNVCGARQ